MKLSTERLRGVALTLVLVVGAAQLLSVVGAHYPVRQWLFWRYAACWLWMGVFSIACVSSGHLVVRALGRPGLDAYATLVLSFPAGVLVFFLGMFACGVAGLYRPPLFVLLPLGLVAAGAPSATRSLVPALRAAIAGAPAPSRGSYPAIAFGALGVVMVYVLALFPERAGLDARWYHMGIAEHYVAQGGVAPFAGGSIVGAIPHLPSFLYAWAFLVPSGALFDRVELCLHLEFVVFLWTLAGVPVLVRHLCGGRGVVASWAAVFLFPGIFVYESDLFGGADHIAALWAVPVFLALVQAWPALDPRACALLAVFAAGALLTKYTAAVLVVAPVLALAARTVFLAASRARAHAGTWRGVVAVLAGPSVALAAGAALTAPHWLKNWIYYGDPFYPALARWFSPRPWTADSDHVYALFLREMNAPGARPPSGPVDVLRTLFSFSFSPHDFPSFHGRVPVFGSLFTLTALCLPFLRGAGRLWGLVAAAHGGLALWAVMFMQDRYLQALVPWMAASTAAVCALVWRAGLLPRVGLAALVGIQIVWGADAYFIPSNTMLGTSTIQAAAGFFAMGFERRYDERLRLFGDRASVAKALPRGARLLVHELISPLGLGVPVVLDQAPYAVAVSHGRTGSMRGMYDALRGMGVTHLLWRAGVSTGLDTLAGDLMFLGFAERHGAARATFGQLSLARMPEAPPPPEAPLWVAYLGCAEGGHAPGLYAVEDLHDLAPLPGEAPRLSPPREPLGGDLRGLLARATFVVEDPACASLPDEEKPALALLAHRGALSLWMRR
jgi:hypothetical protein